MPLVNYVLLMDPGTDPHRWRHGGLRRSCSDPLTREVQAGLAWRRRRRSRLDGSLGDAGRRGAGLLAWRALQESRL